jgi:hypothetical protein
MLSRAGRSGTIGRHTGCAADELAERCSEKTVDAMRRAPCARSAHDELLETHK